jgi:hypothetical protein
MWVLRRLNIHLALLALLLMVAGCDKAGDTSEIKKTGMFTQRGAELIEIPKLGELGNSYGPRLYPEIPDYDIPLVVDVGPIFVNLPDVPASKLKGIEWHGYRLGGNAPAGSRSTALPDDWKAVAIVTEPTKTAGVLKVVVAKADPKTGRWKPEINHEYFGLAVDEGFKNGPIWAVRVK